MICCISLSLCFSHWSMVQLSPTLPIFFFLSPKRLGAGELSIYRILPTCSDSYPLETVTHHPSPSPPYLLFAIANLFITMLIVCAMPDMLRTVTLALFSVPKNKVNRENIILFLVCRVNYIAEKPVIYGLWIWNFFFKVLRKKYIVYIVNISMITCLFVSK